MPKLVNNEYTIVDRQAYRFSQDYKHVVDEKYNQLEYLIDVTSVFELFLWYYHLHITKLKE